MEDVLRLCGKLWPQNYYEIFLERDSNDFFIVPALNARSQILSVLDRRNGVGKPVFKLAPPEHEHPFDLTASDLCVPRISDDVLRQVICQASHLAQNRAVLCVMAAPSPPRRSAAWRVEAPPFRGFPIWWTMQFAIYLARCRTLHDSVPRSREGSQYQCSRPHDTLSCFLYTALWLGQCQIIVTQTQQPRRY